MERVLRLALYIERAECAIGGNLILYMHHSHRVARCIADNLIGGVGVGTETYRYVCLRRYNKCHLLPIAEDKSVGGMILARAGYQFVVFHVEIRLRQVVFVVRTYGSRLDSGYIRIEF